MHLTPNFFFSLKQIYLLFEILLRKIFLIRINPRFSAPRRNLENSSKTPPCCCTTESEENGSSSCYDVYPGRSNISRPLISLRMMQNIYEKCTEMPSRGAIGCCSNIPDLKKDILYNLRVSAYKNRPKSPISGTSRKIDFACILPIDWS